MYKGEIGHLTINGDGKKVSCLLNTTAAAVPGNIIRQTTYV